MAAASAVVVPSTYEGFGLPALEAQLAGTPVVASDAGALPEVCGDAALLVRPTPGGLAEGIVEVCRDGELRAAMAERGLRHSASFTWTRSARGHLDAYRQAFS